MKNTPPLSETEVITLEQIRANHPNYSTRQRASIILFHAQGNTQINTSKASLAFKPLIERYKKFGFICLLGCWTLGENRISTEGATLALA